MSSNIMLFTFILFVSLDFSVSTVFVNTSRGPVLGYHLDNGNDTNQLYYGQADVFLGIPYANPPVGELRLQQTTLISQFSNSPTPWNATYSRPACPQIYANNSQISEDCLYLNIFTPNVVSKVPSQEQNSFDFNNSASSDAKYPVMVWIHGGGYYIGSIRSDVSEYYGIQGAIRNLVSRGVVVVSLQYRLGLLGFFTTLTNDFPSNLGLLDQVLALKFIKEEISNFGGDPSKITLAGNSAGGCSISSHTYSPLSKGLFHQVIIESGTIWTCFDDVMGSDTAVSLSFRNAQSLCNYTQEMWDSKNFTSLRSCLLQKDYHELISRSAWKITVDGNFLLDSPNNLAKCRPNIPIIIGTNKDEWAPWLWHGNFKNISLFNRSTLSSSLNNLLPNLVIQNPEAKDVLGKIFSIDVKDDDNLGWFKLLTQIFTGSFFTGLTGKEVDYYLTNNNPNVYLYEFTWPTQLFQPLNVSGYMPVPHATERYYVWMPEGLWKPVNQSGLFNTTDIEIANVFGEFWTNFVKYGVPSNNSDWLPVNSSKIKPYYEIGSNRGMRLGYRILDQYVWNEVIPDLVGQWPKINEKHFEQGCEAISSAISNSEKIWHVLIFLFLLITFEHF